MKKRERFNPLTGMKEYYLEPEDGAIGPVGPRGERGEKGDKGDSIIGPTGPAGLPGRDGKDGRDGLDGKQGPKGDTGPIGPRGVAGRDGVNGKDAENKNTVHYLDKGIPQKGFGKHNDWCINFAGELFRNDNGRWEFFGSIDSRHEKPEEARTTALSIQNNSVIGSTVQEFIDRMYESAESQKPDYAANGTINYVEFFSASEQVTANRIFRIDLTYNSNQEPLTETVKIYSKTDGTSILRTITKTYTWANAQLTKKTQAVS